MFAMIASGNHDREKVFRLKEEVSIGIFRISERIDAEKNASLIASGCWDPLLQEQTGRENRPQFLDGFPADRGIVDTELFEVLECCQVCDPLVGDFETPRERETFQSGRFGDQSQIFIRNWCEIQMNMGQVSVGGLHSVKMAGGDLGRLIIV
jgi:hypothetical protein